MSEQVKTGVEGLDNVLLGGLSSGYTYVVSGAPGTGKTTLALQFLLAGRAAGDENLLYITLSQTEDELRGAAVSHGFDIAGITIVSLMPVAAGGDSQVQTVLHTSEEDLEELTGTIENAIRENAPQRAVVDSLSELRLVSTSLLRFRRSLLELNKKLAETATTTLLLDGQDEPEVTTSIKLLAHGAIDLDWRTPDYGIAHRRLRVAKMRGAPFVEGYHDFTIQTGGLHVFPRLVPRRQSAVRDEWEIKSGLPELDALAGGSVPGDGTTLISGNAGVGKSILVTKISEETARQGHRCALFLFEELEEAFLKRAKALGMDLGADDVRDNITILHQDPAEVSPGQLFDLITREVDAGARLIVIDSLTGFFKTLPDGEQTMVQFAALLSALKRLKVGVVMTLNLSGFLQYEPSVGVDVSYIADNIILMRQYVAGAAIERSISMVKKRYGRHSREIRRLEITDEGLSIHELPESLTQGDAGQLRES
ncbi:ATPase domain-containing protein [Consotaella aegiceratis]|uniref:ATPase domain-containing protein n=1 Tax=Consotaella aegiceratis TaxID=3097961 RepID=UPI002F3FF590